MYEQDDPHGYHGEPGPAPQVRRGVARRVVRTEIMEVLTEALGLDGEPGRGPASGERSVRRSLRSAVGRVLGSIASAGRGRPALPVPREGPEPYRRALSDGGPGAEEREEGFAGRSERMLSEAQARLDALGGRMDRVRDVLAEQQGRFLAPDTPEAGQELLLAVAGLADQMARVMDDVRRERERMVRQVAELTEAVRSLHEDLARVRAAAQIQPPRTGAVPEARTASAPALPPALVVTVTGLEGFGPVLLLRAALLERPSVQSASVLRYGGGEAELHLVLAGPRPPDDVCALVSGAAGRPGGVASVDVAAGLLRVTLG